MAKKKYVKKGKCIWCLGEEPNVTFYNEPHTFPKSLGGTKIGFDICDSCNKYFGSRDSKLKYQMGPELAFKEIFNISRYAFPTSIFSKNDSIMKSVYFNIYKSKKRFEIKSNFKFQTDFISNFTRQFIKGVYLCFLQEYHLKTEDGLNSRFNQIRDFCLKDIGTLPLYYFDNPGMYLTSKNGEEFNKPELSFGESNINDIMNSGFFVMPIFGHLFFLETSPGGLSTKEFFEKNGVFINFTNNSSGIIKIDNILNIDFLYNNLSNKSKYYK